MEHLRASHFRMRSEHNRFEQAKTRGEAEPAQEDFTQQIQAVPEIASSLVATHVPHDLTKAHPRLILGKQDDIIREHSFQLVGLQNQIQEIQNARDEEAAGKADLLDELRRLREDMTYLKGKLAGLTVEVHSQHPEAKTCRTFKKDSEFQFGQSCHGSSPHRTDMVASESEVWPPPWGESDVTTVAEKVAEQLLLEQRTLLVKGLHEFARMSQNLSPETTDELRELEQTDFHSPLENKRETIPAEEAHDSFSLEERLLQAPTGGAAI